MLQPCLDQLGGYAEIGAYAESEALVLDGEAYGFTCVMGGSEGMNLEVTYLERGAGLDDLDRGELAYQRREIIQSAAREVDRKIETTAHNSRSAHMILMLMGDQQCIQLWRFDGRQIQAARELLSAKACIDEDPGFWAGDKNGISFGATGKYLAKKSHLTSFLKPCRLKPG